MSREDAADRAADEDLPETLDYEAWRDALTEGLLLGQRCQECGAVSATPRQVCLDCGARSVEPVALPTTGVVHSETFIEVTPNGFDDDGYRAGIVDLGEARVFARLGGEAAIGDEVSFEGPFEGGDGPVPLFD